MTKKDWYEAGDQIKNIVQSAVDSGDFSQLGTTISNIVNDTMDGLEDAFRDSLGGTTSRPRGERPGRSDAGKRYGGNSGRIQEQDREFRYSRSQDQEYWRERGRNASDYSASQGGTERDQGREVRKEARDSRKREYDWARETRQFAADQIRRNMEQSQQKKQYHPVRKKIKAPGQISGTVMKWTGYTCGGMLGLALAILAAIGITMGTATVMPPISILGVLFAGFACLGAAGKSRLGLAKRFRKYTDVLGERTFCLIEELASAVGESSKFVRKDLKKMIRRGFFPQGYIDQKETCLITDKATYQQYLTTQQAYVERELSEEQAKRGEKTVQKEKEKEEKMEPTGKSADGRKLSPECMELISQGKNYIRHIHECNDRIEDEEMSAKLDRLETVVTRIFTEAEKDPEVVDDLKKMMSYYLPTTKKLLDAYCELDIQPVQGQNIAGTKKEIEQALDTLNSAFEKLLDNLFEDKAWDISSDITVLNTMLAQEGLTGKDFANIG